MLTVTITNLLDQALFAVILPDYAKQILRSAAALGAIIAAFGGASFVGTILYGAIGHRLPRRLTFGIAFTLGGALRFWVLALVPPLFVILIVHIIAGVAAGCLNPILNTVEYERTPVEMRARVFGTITAIAFAAIPLGGLLGGYLVAWIGIVFSLFILGACYFVTTLSLLVNPALKNMEKIAGTQGELL